MAIKLNQEGVSHCMHLAQTGRVNHGKWNEASVARNEKNKLKFLAIDDSFKPDEVGHWKYPVVGNDDHLNRKALGNAQGYASKNGETAVAEACQKIAEVADKVPDHRASNPADSGLEVRLMPFRTAEFRMQQDGDNLVMRGYAAVYNSLSEVISDDDGNEFREMVMPGAFDRTLASDPDVRLLVNHDDLPLARTRSKTLTLSSDGRGLSYAANLDPSDPDVQRVVKKVKRGDVDQCSFSFRCLSHTFDRSNSEMPVRELRDVDIHDGDVSVVTYPAYKATFVGVRGYEAARRDFQEFRKAQLSQASRDINHAVKSSGLSLSTAERLLYAAGLD